MENAANPIQPPEEAGFLCKKGREIFDCFAMGKAKDDWYPHEIRQLVTLARITLKLERAQTRLLRKAGVVITPTGAEAVDPLNTLCDSLLRQQLALSRSLNLASSKRQKKQQIGHRAKKEEKARGTIAKKGLFLATAK